MQQTQMQNAEEERKLVREQLKKEKEDKEANQEKKHEHGLNNTRMIDTNNSLKMKTWAGEQALFETFKRSVYMCISALSAVHLEKLQIVEGNREPSNASETLTESDKVQAREIFQHVASHVEG